MVNVYYGICAVLQFMILPIWVMHGMLYKISCLYITIDVSYTQCVILSLSLFSTNPSFRSVFFSIHPLWLSLSIEPTYASMFYVELWLIILVTMWY